MPTIQLTDSVGLTVDLKFDDESDLGRFGLTALRSKITQIGAAIEKPIDEGGFESAEFGVSFTSPAIALEDGLSLTIEPSSDATIRIITSAKKKLFGDDDASPGIAIGENEAWISFSLKTKLDVALGASAPSGFGVTGETVHVDRAGSYALLQRQNGRFPTLKEAIELALSKFKLLRTVADLLEQPSAVLYEFDTAGTFSIAGTYQLPVTMNAYALAALKLPFGQSLQIGPDPALKLSGSLSVTGEFRTRSYRDGNGRLNFGLYKQRGTDLTASLHIGAGMEAAIGSTDLVGALFSILPGASLDEANVPKEDRKAMSDSLSCALNQGLSIALNASCSAASVDEAAILYSIDAEAGTQELRLALDSALHGNWKLLSTTPAAREIRNVTTETHKSGCKTTLNLLGIYDCASVQEFARQCTVVHDNEDGSITVTDRETAGRISVSASNLAAKSDKLRGVLDEAFLATVTYKAGIPHHLLTELSATQNLLVYQAKSNAGAVRKSLLLGCALNVLDASEIAELVSDQQFQYVRLSAQTTFGETDALKLFFSDVPARTQRKRADLIELGRQVLYSLLDQTSPVDEARSRILNDDAAWAQLDNQQFPKSSPASYSDWCDITFWADSITGVAPQLKAVLDAANRISVGDPSKDPKFMASREALAKALATVTRSTNAAFEKGWPIAAMFTLSGKTAAVSFEAQWNGKRQIEKQSNKAMTA